MEQSTRLIPFTIFRRPWNKGRLSGPKPSLRSKHIWSIRTQLQLEGRKRELAPFNLAIDSKLRGCDVVAVKVVDVVPNGYAIGRATVQQKKTGHPVRFEITEHSRQSLDDDIRTDRRQRGDFLFQGRMAQVVASRPVNMHAWFQIGLRAAVWTPVLLALIHCIELRPL